VAQETEIAKTRTPRLWLPVLLLLATLAPSSQVPSSTDELKSSDLNLILQRLEDVQHQDPAQSRPYEVTREYKVFRGDMTTYKITQARGSSIGERIVRELLDLETEAARKAHGSKINGTNYDFVFLRQETFGVVVPE
jgi:hypothetical protein